MLSHRRRAALIGAGALVAGALVPLAAHGQSYPSQTIRLLVPNAAGGLADTVARIVGRRMQERMGQSVVVENRPGGNGSIAALTMIGAPADGHIFLSTDSSIISINPAIYKTLTYNPRDLIPVVLIARAPMYLAAHPKVPVRTMKEFIDYAKANPGKLNYGSSGVGSTHQLSMEAIKAALKLDMAHIPYKGAGESVPALIGGHVDVLFAAYPALSGAAETKRVTLLGTNGLTRTALAPDVPPIADFIPGYEFAPLQGFFARAGTPQAIIQKVAAEVAAIVKEPDIIKQFTVAGIESDGAGAEVFARVLQADVERIAKVVQSAGIKPE